jgi:hypothetical protein
VDAKSSGGGTGNDTESGCVDEEKFRQDLVKILIQAIKSQHSSIGNKSIELENELVAALKALASSSDFDNPSA